MRGTLPLLLCHVGLSISSVAQLCPILCDPMDCRMSSFPVHHKLLKLALTHVHRVGDAIQQLILCSPLCLLPSVIPNISFFFNEPVLWIRWPKYWSFSFSTSPSIEYSGLLFLLGWTGLISLQSKGLSRIFSNTTVQKHQYFGAQLSLWSNSHIHT